MEHSSTKGSSIEPQPIKQPYEAGDLIISYLEQLGVEYVFGVPGGAIEPFYNALARSERRGGPRAIVARHESGAAFMADGYARETGKLGVCCATTGPGATNMITGVASAYQDNIPMLVITAQTLLSTFGKNALQESSCTAINTVGMFQYCTRYNTLVSHIEQLEYKLASAIMTAYRSPFGPVHLSIPLDIMCSNVNSISPSFKPENLLMQPSFVDEVAVNDLVQLIIKSKRIVFLVGNGCAEGIGSVLELALLLNVPVLTTPHGKGLVSSYHPQFYGVFGFAGHDSANKLLTNSDTDLVLAIGTGLGEWDSSGWDKILVLNDKLVHIDYNFENFAHSPMARLHVGGRISSIFKVLLGSIGHHKKSESTNTKYVDKRGADNIVSIKIDKRLLNRRRSSKSSNSNSVVSLHLSEKRCFDRRRNHHMAYGSQRRFKMQDEKMYVDESTPIKPQRLMHDLSRLFPTNTRYLADNGNSFVWATHYLHPLDRRVAGYRAESNGFFRAGIGYASMGWAIGSSIGTALASHGNPVVCITGDGSVLMSGQEITVAVAEKLTVIFVVLNDSALGMVKHGQLIGGGEPVAYTLPRVNFTMLAKSMGINAYTVRSPHDMAALDIDAICKAQAPTLLDVYIDPREIPPMDLRLKVLRGHQ